MTPEPARGHVETDGNGARRTLSAAEATETIVDCRRYALSLLLNAIKSIAEIARSGGPRLRLSAATTLCEINGLFQSGGIEGLLRTIASLEQKRNEQRLCTYGAIFAMTLHKFQKYKVPFPPGVAEQIKEIATTVDKLNKPDKAARPRRESKRAKAGSHKSP